MKKVNEGLGTNENIVYRGEISRATLIPHILLMMLIIGIITIWKPIIHILTTELCITNKKVIGKTGVFKIKTLDSPLNKINNFSIEQGLVGRLLKYGTVRIDTSSGMYEFKYIHDPDKFKRKLTDQINAYEEEKLRRQAEMIAGAKE